MAGHGMSCGEGGGDKPYSRIHSSHPFYRVKGNFLVPRKKSCFLVAEQSFLRIKIYPSKDEVMYLSGRKIKGKEEKGKRARQGKREMMQYGMAQSGSAYMTVVLAPNGTGNIP